LFSEIKIKKPCVGIGHITMAQCTRKAYMHPLPGSRWIRAYAQMAWPRGSILGGCCRIYKDCYGRQTH